MRIIAGEYGGRRLTTVRDLSIRPTTDRAKQTMFDILSNRVDFDGMHVLDLFSGSGSLGLEALSRGAASVTFVEKSSTSIDVLKENIDALGVGTQCTIHQADVFWFLKHCPSAFDMVFTDPPYKLESIGTIPPALYASGALRNGTYVVMEHSRESFIDLRPGQYEVLTKPFGQTVVLILQAIVPATAERTQV